LASVPAPRAPYKNPNCDGNRHVVVHLFEWRWNDIATSANDFSAPTATAECSEPAPTGPVERYQPVSYILVSRSGNEQEFKKHGGKVHRNGVRIYVDAVINHMAGVGVSGRAPQAPITTPGLPGVPYSDWDFNGRGQCSTASLNIENYHDPVQVRNCRLVGLTDLQTGKDYVQRSIAGYLNKLVGTSEVGRLPHRRGQAHVPDHRRAAFSAGIVNNLNSSYFRHGKRRPSSIRGHRPGGVKRIKNSRYTRRQGHRVSTIGAHLSRAFSKHYPPKHLPRNFGEQHGGGGAILTFRQSKMYKRRQPSLLAHPAHRERQRTITTGSDRTAYGDGTTKPVSPINPDLTCGDGWILRASVWRQIYGHGEFRNVVSGTGLNKLVATAGQPTRSPFSRGNRLRGLHFWGGDLRTSIRPAWLTAATCDVHQRRQAVNEVQGAPARLSASSGGGWRECAARPERGRRRCWPFSAEFQAC
uniref:alpha-amylase n=1 Tax=Macrostomum lignano TaxID=282301 RepID=A0A1I8FGP7_9PLAT